MEAFQLPGIVCRYMGCALLNHYALDEWHDNGPHDVQLHWIDYQGCNQFVFFFVLMHAFLGYYFSSINMGHV